MRTASVYSDINLKYLKYYPFFNDPFVAKADFKQFQTALTMTKVVTDHQKTKRKKYKTKTYPDN